MEEYIHKISKGKDAWFLHSGRVDGITKNEFDSGDEVVVCGGCKTVWLLESWHWSGKCPSCKCEETILFSRENIMPSNTEKIRFVEKQETKIEKTTLDIQYLFDLMRNWTDVFVNMVCYMMNIIPYLFYAILLVAVVLTVYRICKSGPISFMIDKTTFNKGIYLFTHWDIETLYYFRDKLFYLKNQIIYSVWNCLIENKMVYLWKKIRISVEDIYRKNLYLIQYWLNLFIEYF